MEGVGTGLLGPTRRENLPGEVEEGSEVEREAIARAPGCPRTRWTWRVWPPLGSGPCSQPAVARSSASRFESVLAGEGSAESET